MLYCLKYLQMTGVNVLIVRTKNIVCIPCLFPVSKNTYLKNYKHSSLSDEGSPFISCSVKSLPSSAF